MITKKGKRAIWIVVGVVLFYVVLTLLFIWLSFKPTNDAVKRYTAQNPAFREEYGRAYLVVAQNMYSDPESTRTEERVYCESLVFTTQGEYRFQFALLFQDEGDEIVAQDHVEIASASYAVLLIGRVSTYGLVMLSVLAVWIMRRLLRKANDKITESVCEDSRHCVKSSKLLQVLFDIRSSKVPTFLFLDCVFVLLMTIFGIVFYYADGLLYPFSWKTKLVANLVLLGIYACNLLLLLVWRKTSRFCVPKAEPPRRE